MTWGGVDGYHRDILTGDAWPIIRAVGFATLRLGDKRSDVRARFGEFRTLRRTDSAPESDQFFPSSGGSLMVTYDDAGRVVFIETAKPLNPTIDGVPLMGRQADEVARDLRPGNIELSEFAPDVLAVVGWSVRLWVPMEEVESVGIGADDA